MEEKEYKFSEKEIETQIPFLVQKEITEFVIHDSKIAKDKKRILSILALIKKHAPNVFISLYIDVSVIDREVASKACELFCSFEIPINYSVKGERLLFDKKYYANKAKVLNDFGIVFGFYLSYACNKADTLKLFMERLDFAVMQYPNHIEFPALENSELCEYEPVVSGFFSAKDIRYARDIAFACKTFYSSGRAVSWFLSVLKPLRLNPSKFFSDFAEWQRCNNCDFKSGFIPEKENHTSLEKMQILFVKEKYEEKNRNEYLDLVSDLIKINGAMSRLVAENQESILETSFHPEDLFSPEVFDLESFLENVCMEHCKVRIFVGDEGPDFIVE